MRMRRVSGGLVVAVLVTGCSGGPFGSDPVPAVPEPDPPVIPTLTDLPSPSPTEAGQPAPAAAPDPTPDPVDGGADLAPPETADDPAALGRQLGIAGLVELLDEDPDLVGERGDDLLDDLEDILDSSGRSGRRDAERLLDRIPRWVEEGELDAGIGTAAVAALEQWLEAADPPDSDDDDDDDDD